MHPSLHLPRASARGKTPHGPGGRDPFNKVKHPPPWKCMYLCMYLQVRIQISSSTHRITSERSIVLKWVDVSTATSTLVRSLTSLFPDSTDIGCNSVILQLCRICGLEAEHEQTCCSWSTSEVCSWLSISLSKSLTFIIASSLSFWAVLCRHQVN